MGAFINVPKGSAVKLPGSCFKSERQQSLDVALQPTTTAQPSVSTACQSQVSTSLGSPPRGDFKKGQPQFTATAQRLQLRTIPMISSIAKLGTVIMRSCFKLLKFGGGGGCYVQQ